MSPPVSFGIDSTDVEVEAFAEDGWIRGTQVFVTSLITDPDAGLGSSGVDLSSVEFSLLLAGSSGWSPWSAPDELIEVEGTATVQATTRLELGEGVDNYVRWRARDTAGNALVVTPPDMIKVDLTSPALLSHWPREGTFDVPEDGRSLVSFTDAGGSGIDMATLEYSVSLGGPSDYGDWESTIPTGDPDDLVKAEVPIVGLVGHDNWIVWRVSDLAGNGPAEFGPFRMMVNLPPTAMIATPQEGQSFRTEDIVGFSGEGSSDPDVDDQLTFHWWSDKDGMLGSGPEIRIPLTSGEHRITLYVDDGLGGDHTASATVTVKVSEPTQVQEPISLWLILLIVLITVGTIATVREWRARRRRDLEGLL
jgi:hypothetical protein